MVLALMEEALVSRLAVRQKGWPKAVGELDLVQHQEVLEVRQQEQWVAREKVGVEFPVQSHRVFR